MENFIRKTLLLLDAGSRVLRYFITQIETELPKQSVCDFLRTRTDYIQSSKLLQSQKKCLLETDVQDWEFSLLAFAINELTKDAEFDKCQKQFVRFMVDHRNMLGYSGLLEVGKSAFQNFLDCFEKSLDAFVKDPDFIYDLRALTLEIEEADIEHLEKNCLVRNEIVNIRLKEYLSIEDAERKSEIQQCLMKLLENSTEHLTIDLQLLPKDDDEQENVKKWLNQTNHRRDCKPYNALMTRLASFGPMIDKGAISICVVLNCNLTRWLSLLTFLDGTRFSELLENISTEISKFSGKDIHIYLETMHVAFLERRQEQKSLVGTGSIYQDPARLDLNFRRQGVSEKLRKLQRAVEMCRADDDLMKCLDDELLKISDKIRRKKETLEMIKIIVICEPHSGAHSFLNKVVFGHSLLPPSLGNITRIKYGKELKITTEITKDTSVATFVSKALSGFAKDDINRGEFEMTKAVEVVWPFKSSVLLDNVEWIVMPETATDTDVTNMMSGAHGLLYIANAGSSNCLKDEKIQTLSSFEEKIPVFILNRWDHIQYNSNFDVTKKRAKDYAYDRIIQRLNLYFPHMNETQVLRFCRNEVEGMVEPKNSVLRLLENLIDNSRSDISVQKESRWIHAKASLMKEKVGEVKTNITASLENLREARETIKQKSHQKEIEKMQTCITKTEELVQRIESHLQSSLVKHEISNLYLGGKYCYQSVHRPMWVTYDVDERFTMGVEEILKRDFGLEPLRMIEWKTSEIVRLFKQWLPYGKYYDHLNFDRFVFKVEWDTSSCSHCGNALEHIYAIDLSSIENSVKDYTDFLSKYQYKELRAQIDTFFNEKVPLGLAEFEKVEEKKKNALKRYGEITELLKQILHGDLHVNTCSLT